MVAHYTDDTTYHGLIGLLLDHVEDAVELFFVMSGFVLAKVYGDESRFWFARFLGHRIARIYPLYALTTLICFGMVHAGLRVYGDPTATGPALAANLAMVQSWGWPSNSLNGPGWSISTEWAANLLFPFFSLILLRWPMRRAVVTLAIGVAAVVFSDSTESYRAYFCYTPLLVDLHWLRVPEPLLAGPVSFMVGMFGFRLVRDTAEARRLSGDTIQALILVVISGWMLTDTPDIVFVVMVGLLVTGLSYEKSALSRLLAIAPLHWLGLISFSIYLIHAPLLSLLSPLTDALKPAVGTHARGLSRVIIMGASIAGAALCFHLIEQPCRRFLRRVFDRYSAVSVATPII